MAPRNGEREELEKEIERDEYRELLRQLQRECPFLRDFRTWGEVLSFMRKGSSTDPEKDEVLRPILSAMTEDRWRCCHTILFAIFYPGLDSIFNRFERRETDEQERWQNVVLAFLKTIRTIDLSMRSDRLVQKIINCTMRRFREQCRRIWIRAKREVATDPDLIEDMMGGGEDVSFDEIDRQSKQEAEIKRLRAHADAGRISEADFLLLVGTRVYGKSVAEYAREIGMKGELARKRRLRAEAALSRAEGRK